MAEKSFLEKFNKYQPSDTEIIRVLSSVKAYSVRLNKEARVIEADVHFDSIVNNFLFRLLIVTAQKYNSFLCLDFISCDFAELVY